MQQTHQRSNRGWISCALDQLEFELFHEPVTTDNMRRLGCQEDSEQLFCLGAVMAIALKFRDDFALPRNVTFAEGHMLFGLY